MNPLVKTRATAEWPQLWSQQLAWVPSQNCQRAITDQQAWRRIEAGDGWSQETMNSARRILASRLSHQAP